MIDGDRENLIAELVRTQLPALVLFARQWKHEFRPKTLCRKRLSGSCAWRSRRTILSLGFLPRSGMRLNQHLRSEKRRKCRENASQGEKEPWFGSTEDENELVADSPRSPLRFPNRDRRQDLGKPDVRANRRDERFVAKLSPSCI